MRRLLSLSLAALVLSCGCVPTRKPSILTNGEYTRIGRSPLVLTVNNNDGLEQFHYVDPMTGTTYVAPLRTCIKRMGIYRTRDHIAYNPSKGWLASVITRDFPGAEKPRFETFVGPAHASHSGSDIEFSCAMLESQPPREPETRKICIYPVIGGLSWSPDWRMLAFVIWNKEKYELSIYDVDNGKIKTTITIPGKYGRHYSSTPPPAPSWIDEEDLLVLAYEQQAESKGTYQIFLVDLKKKTPKRILRGHSAVYLGGGKIAYSYPGYYEWRPRDDYDVKIGCKRWCGDEEKVYVYDIEEGTSSLLFGFSADLSISRDRNFLAARSGRGKFGHPYLRIYDLRNWTGATMKPIQRVWLDDYTTNVELVSGKLVLGKDSE